MLIRKSKVKELSEKIERLKVLETEKFNIPSCFYLSLEDRLENSIRLSQFNIWAANIDRYKKARNIQSLFNIRTYRFYSTISSETVNTPHIVNLSLEELLSLISNFKSLKSKKINDLEFLIDSETPQNGLLSGNVVLHTNNPPDRFLRAPHGLSPLSSRTKETFTIEFCSREGAMVRQADRSISGDLSSVSSILKNYLQKYYNLLHPDSQNHLISSNIIFDSSLEKQNPNIKNLEFFILSTILQEARKFYKRSVILEWTFFRIPSGKLKKNIVWWEYRKF